MMTTRTRFAVLAVAVVLLGYTFYERNYEVSAVVGLGIVLLIRGYFKEGTVVLAAKAFRNKEYQKAETLLKEIRNPDYLRKARRGYYEFIYGNIELQRENYNEAELHFQIASRFPLSSENDKGIVLVHLANLNLRKKEYDRARAYIEIAKDLKISARIQSIIERIEKEIQKP
ncbi:tetratricopeptide repeat protein [Arcticibacter tournemirensis]